MEPKNWRVSPLFQKHIGYGKMFCNCLFHLGCYTVAPIATLVILNFVNRWSYCMVGQMGLQPCYGSKRVGTPNILLYTLFCCKQKDKRHLVVLLPSTKKNKKSHQKINLLIRLGFNTFDEFFFALSIFLLFQTKHGTSKCLQAKTNVLLSDFTQLISLQVSPYTI